MGGLLALLRCVTGLVALWSITSVIVAVPVATLFRMQARAEHLWRKLDRRKAWREASGCAR